jgi:exonuclease VII large subunit
VRVWGGGGGRRGGEDRQLTAGIDVVIVRRGGRSRRWAFATEAVAQAIVASRIPVSAVGHGST